MMHPGNNLFKQPLLRLEELSLTNCTLAEDDLQNILTESPKLKRVFMDNIVIKSKVSNR